MHPVYPNQGPPSTSTQLRPAPMTSNQFGPPSTMTTPQYPQQQPQPPPLQPPFPNQPQSSGLGGVPSYQQTQYPGSQPPYNAPSSSFPAGGQPPPPPSSSTGVGGYPQQQLPTQYPNQSNLSGPPTMPGSQLNGSSAYPGQTSSSGPVQQPYQPQRIDPDMVPNVVCFLFLYQDNKKESIELVHCFFFS